MITGPTAHQRSSGVLGLQIRPLRSAIAQGVLHRCTAIRRPRHRAAQALCQATSNGNKGHGTEASEQGPSDGLAALLQESIQLQRQQVALLDASFKSQRRHVMEGKRVAELDQLRQRRDKRYSSAIGVAGSLEVVSALLAAALLAPLLSFPDEAVKVEVWKGSKGGVPVACYSTANPAPAPGAPAAGPAVSGKDDLSTCLAWRARYDYAASAAFAMEMVSLLMTVAVAMGNSALLQGAVLFFVLGSGLSAVAVVAALWLSSPIAVVNFATAAMACLLGASLFLLPSAALTVLYPLYLPLYLLVSRERGFDGLQWAARESGRRSVVYKFVAEALLRFLVLTEELNPSDRVPPLCLAARVGNLRALEILLDVGADPNHSMTRAEMESLDQFGESALQAALGPRGATEGALHFSFPPPSSALPASSTAPTLSEEELDRGGYSAVFEAVAAGMPEAAELLLRSGGDPNKPAYSGTTPLHVAAESGQEGLVRLLLKYGAKPDAVDGSKRTPCHSAAAAGHGRVLAHLLRHQRLAEVQGQAQVAELLTAVQSIAAPTGPDGS